MGEFAVKVSPFGGEYSGGDDDRREAVSLEATG